MIQILGVYFRYGQRVPSKMTREFEESDILLSHVVQNPDCGEVIVGETNNPASRSSKFALKRLDTIGCFIETLLKKTFKGFHSF